MEKVIVYFGGYFMSERSLERSFADNGIKVLFPVDVESNWYKQFILNKGGGNVIQSMYSTPFLEVKDDTFEIEQFLKKVSPIAVIHRMYKNDFVMNYKAGEVCSKLKIPYYPYRIETWPLEKVKSFECTNFLYAHKCDIPFMRNVKSKKTYFPYGVSSLERNLKLQKTIEIAGFGFGRLSLQERFKDIEMYYDAVESLGKNMTVFWNKTDIELFRERKPSKNTRKKVITWQEDTDQVDYRNQKILIPRAKEIPDPDYESIEFSPLFSPEETEQKINSAKIVVNFDTCWGVQDAHSYKLYQSMGCGVPTITHYKKGIENDFGPNGENLIYVKDSKEAAFAITRLLKDKDFYNKISTNCEKFVHEKYNWFKNFDKIAKEDGLW